MKTFAFLTHDSFRIEVLASCPKSGYRKLRSIISLRDRITKSYLAYNKDGLASIYGWKTLDIN